MTEEEITFDKREIPLVQKNNKKKYWQHQNLKRMNVGLSRKLMKRFRDIRASKSFSNDDQMLEFLLDIANSAQEKGVIEETKVCAECGAPIEVQLADYTGITHGKIDRNSDCFGCIKTRFGLIDKKDKETGTKEVKKMTQEEFDKEYGKGPDGLYSRLPDHF